MHSEASADSWSAGGVTLTSRILLGTSRYPSPAALVESIKSSGAEILTVSLRRESAAGNAGARFWDYLKDLPVRILPNTAGCYTAAEAVATAHLARELFGTPWVKLEVIGNDYTLQPDPFGLVDAARRLVKDGFVVFPYTTDDLIVAERLVDAGCRVLMPWAAPIGTGRGPEHPRALRALRARFPDLPLIVDAGLGRPSHVAAVMELGFDAVLLNTAVAAAGDPPAMAAAFAAAVVAGRRGFKAGLMAPRELAEASTPLAGRAFT